MKVLRLNQCRGVESVIEIWGMRFEARGSFDLEIRAGGSLLWKIEVQRTE